MTFLEKIIKEKREEIKIKKKEKSIEELKAISMYHKKRPFFELFKERFPGDVKIIAEIKLSSPSSGTLASDIEIDKLAEIYAKAGAYSISVITEEKYFNGRKEFISLVRNAVHMPLLRKDFIVDVYEIYESKAIGADCVLLIGEAVDRQLLKDCLQVAKEIDIDCLVEVHGLSAFEKVADLNGFILGINNRDLKTLKVDISNGLEMLNHIPIDMPVVIESGIEKREDIIMFTQRGVSGFLIGTALMKAVNPLKKILELRGIYGNKG